MKLSKLISVIQPLSVSLQKDCEIEGLSENSRTVGSHFLFFARKGTKVSGLDFVKDALNRGASAIATDLDIKGCPVPVIRVSSVSEAESRIAECFYEYPSKDLTVVGVTGTNGKTTFTYLLESVAREMGWRTGIVGTINYRLPKNNSDDVEIFPAPNTTPNPLEMQKILYEMRKRKTDLVIMEVSSHALALGRVKTVEFDGAVFTNLTQDHLDFHKTMEEYFDAKSILFKTINPEKKVKKSSVSKVSCDKFCIINSDDSYGERMIHLSPVRAMTYGIDSKSSFTAQEIRLEPSGTLFNLVYSDKSVLVKLHLLGRHNVYNALAVFASAYDLNIPVSVIVRGLEKIESVPGRLESVRCGQNFTVVVDYAHTEDALKNVLQSLRPFAKKRILTLFGCGGDRDRSKRPLMGATAALLSDWVVISSDNPRSEDPKRIALDIEVGIHRVDKKNYEIVLDREKAVEKILKTAQKDDIVLIAGKGHETVQIFSDRTVHFDDRETVRKFLSQP